MITVIKPNGSEWVAFNRLEIVEPKDGEKIVLVENKRCVLLKADYERRIERLYISLGIKKIAHNETFN